MKKKNILFYFAEKYFFYVSPQLAHISLLVRFYLEMKIFLFE
jgi:hypothetical protein